MITLYIACKYVNFYASSKNTHYAFFPVGKKIVAHHLCFTPQSLCVLSIFSVVDHFSYFFIYVRTINKIMLNCILILLGENICIRMFIWINIKKKYLEKQFHRFWLGFAATTDSRAARNGARDGASGATVNFTGRLISANIGGKLKKSVRTFHLHINPGLRPICTFSYCLICTFSYWLFFPTANPTPLIS